MRQKNTKHQNKVQWLGQQVEGRGGLINKAARRLIYTCTQRRTNHIEAIVQVAIAYLGCPV